MRNVLGHQPQLGIVKRPYAITEYLGAHVHAAQMVFKIVRKDAEKLIFVFRELLQFVTSSFQSNVGADP